MVGTKQGTRRGSGGIPREIRAIFMHFPKTGGSALGTGLVAPCAPYLWRVAHDRCVNYENHLPKHIWDKAFKFGVLRDPYDRWISSFYHWGYWSSRARARMRQGETVPLEEHVHEFEKWALMDQEESSFFWQNADLMYCDDDGSLMVDHLYRYEDGLQSIADDVTDRIKVARVEIQQVNVRKHRPRVDVSLYYQNDKVRSKIEQVCAWEFEQGEYK